MIPDESIDLTGEIKSSGDEEVDTGKTSSRIKKIFKLLAGLFLLAAVLLWKDNYLKLVDVFSTFKLGFFILTISVSILLNLLSAYKWKMFVNQFAEVRLGRLFSLYLIGKYFSNFLPSMVGGDLSRIYILGKQINSHSKATATIFFERITGLFALLLLAGIFALFNLKILGNEVIKYSLGGMILLGILFVLLLFSPEFFKSLESRLAKFKLLKKGVEKVKLFNEDIISLRNEPKLLIKTMGLSFLFHLSTSLLVFSACLSINFYPDFLSIFFISPIIFLVVSLPVSPNNIGWWEWVFTIILIYVGASPAQGLAVALTIRAAVFIISLPGAFLVGKENFNKK